MQYYQDDAAVRLKLSAVPATYALERNDGFQAYQVDKNGYFLIKFQNDEDEKSFVLPGKDLSLLSKLRPEKVRFKEGP